MRARPTAPALLLAAGLAATLAAAGCRNDGRDLAPSTVNGTQSILPSTTNPDAPEFGDLDTLPGEEIEGGENLPGDTSGFVESDEEMSVALPFNQGQPIQARYTCDGENESPSVDWFDLPEGTVEVAIELADLDAPEFVHWVVAGIDPAVGRLEDGELPQGVVQARNSNGDIGYTGPCPPPSQTHTYLITVSALDRPIDVPDGADAATFRAAIGEATIQAVTETGTFTG